MALSLALALAVLATAWAQSPARAAGSFDRAPANFEILSVKTGKVIGHARYTIERASGRTFIHGLSRYLNGEYDIEIDQIAMVKGRALPVLVESRHSFFNSLGQLDRESYANIRSGFASCIQRIRGKKWARSKKLEFPADTYAGASAMLAVQDYLRRKGHGRAILRLHDFNCVPSPRVLAFDVQAAPGKSRWKDYPVAPLVKVELTPYFGFFTILMRPFFPRITAWFDPRNKLQFVGGDFERYYRGPMITLVKVPTTERSAKAGVPRRWYSPPKRRH